MGYLMMRTSKVNENRGNSTMNKRLDRISVVICLMCAWLFLQVQAHAATLDDISFSSLPGDRVQLELKLSEPVSEKPLNFTIDNPARIVLDFPDTNLNLAEKSKNIGVGAVHSVSSVEAAGRTRVRPPRSYLPFCFRRLTRGILPRGRVSQRPRVRPG